MSDYRFMLISDSTNDLPKIWYEENDARCVPHGLVIDGKEYWDDFGAAMPPKKVYDYIRGGGMPSTVQGNLEKITEYFEESCKAGMDSLYLVFSSKLSGTYATACMVADEMMQKYPGRRVLCVDSRCAAMGHGMLVMLAQKLRAQGMTADAAAAELEKRCLQVCHFFTVDDLNHLYRGGRLSKAEAVLGSLIGIKPILYIDDTGKLVPIGKKRGRHQAIEELARLTADHIKKPQDQTIFIPHGDCLGDAEELARLLHEQLPGVQTEIYMLGSTIGTHTGPGVLATLFWGDKRL